MDKYLIHYKERSIKDLTSFLIHSTNRNCLYFDNALHIVRRREMILWE